ncbi:MAG: non-hydrolyzing UDP-N-acetylglucosamine 2-epimerase [Syntrophorhabdaceae bacterium]
MKLLLIAGARPNFMKIAPIIRALRSWPSPVEWKLVHTGQHYDYDMSGSFFKELEIPDPDYHLEAGSGTHAQQTAKIMLEFEQVCLAEMPDVVIVVGDVNSTLACSITAKKMGIKVSHVEAGLRSGDWAMPEEINRVVTDSISDYLFVTEKSGINNLLQEGKRPNNIHFVGHVMVDNLLYVRSNLDEQKLRDSETGKLKERLGKYVFLTLHRPSNVDEPKIFSGIIDALNEIARDIPIVFPVHPRTRRQLDINGFNFSESLILLTPLSFKASLYLWKNAVFVLTDSGGLQEETTALGIPCFTILENTERPVNVEEGTNTLVGNSPGGILTAYRNFRNGKAKKGRVPELWDGHAADRIIKILTEKSVSK